MAMTDFGRRLARLEPPRTDTATVVVLFPGDPEPELSGDELVIRVAFVDLRQDVRRP